MDHPKYPHVENLYQGEAILEAPWVTVTEKIDGFNVRIGRDADGATWLGTRNRDLDQESDRAQGFTVFALKTLKIFGMLPVGVTLFGEWAGKGIQKRLDYGEPGFWLLDGLDLERGWFSQERLEWHREVYQFHRPRIFHVGPPPTLAQLEGWRDTEGIEGIVIRAYPMALDKYGHPLIAKLKSAQFAERASERRTTRIPADLSTVKAFVEEYATAERLDHVLRQVAESLTDEPVDSVDPLDVRLTGDVLRAMYADIVREGRADFDALSEADQKMVGKVQAPVTKALLEAARLAAAGGPVA